MVPVAVGARSTKSIGSYTDRYGIVRSTQSSYVQLMKEAEEERLAMM